MSDCSKHKKEVAGISDMKVLAEMIGDLHYECLQQLLSNLSAKFIDDGVKDYNAGRTKIANTLFNAAYGIDEAYENIDKAWEISKPFMNIKQ